MNHPSVDDIVIHDLSGRKLELKDEITRLSKEISTEKGRSRSPAPAP